MRLDYVSPTAGKDCATTTAATGSTQPPLVLRQNFTHFSRSLNFERGGSPLPTYLLFPFTLGCIMSQTGFGRWLRDVGFGAHADVDEKALRAIVRQVRRGDKMVDENS